MRRIDLTVPKGYAQCSLAQLRAISAILIGGTQQATLLRPFDMTELKTAVFFRLTGIEVLGSHIEENDDGSYYTCRLLPYSLDDESKPLKCAWLKLKAWWRRRVLAVDDTFPFYLWQIADFLLKRKDEKGNVTRAGVLDWLDADSRSNLLVFPFASVKRKGVCFNGPAPLMDGFTWQRYRFAQDFMQNYIDVQNAVVKKKEAKGKLSFNELKSLAEQIDNAQAMFLAVIFERKVRYIDADSGIKRYDFHYQPDQYSQYAKYFRHFPAVDWQIVLIWWQSMMYYLQKTYPRVYKKQKVGGKKKKKVANPLELYTRTTATIEKYLGVTAKDVDNEPYTTILQQLEDIMLNNEEMEKIKKKK